MRSVQQRSVAGLAMLLAALGCALASAAEFPSIKAVLNERMGKIEKDLATRMIHRGEAKTAGLPLETQIDLRVIQRWLLVQAANAKAESDVQIAALLRVMQLAGATTQLEESLKEAGALSKTQADAAAQIHQLSFDMGDGPNVAQLDDLCKKLGYAMVNLSAADPVDYARIPVMRPKPIAAPATSGKAQAGPRTATELITEISRSTVSATLRQQLLVMGRAAAAAESDPERAKEAAALTKTLADGVDLAKGLSGTTAFSQQTRSDIEVQLSEGLALFGDSRTRSAGVKRIGELSQYRQVMNRIGSSSLSPEQRAALGPAIAYVQTHPAEGGKVLDVLDEYAGVCSRYDAIAKRDNPVANLRPATEEAARQVEAARKTFIASSRDVGSGVMAVSPDTLQGQVEELASLVDLYQVLDGMQHTYEVLNAYKPRPFGALEARMQKLAMAATAPFKGQARADAMRVLFDLSRLTRLVDSMGKRTTADIPPVIAQQYAGVSTGDVDLKIRAMMTELALQAATGMELDGGKIARLKSVSGLCDGLRVAAEFEAALKSVPALSRWADWRLTAEQLSALMSPYRQMMTRAFSAFMNDDSGDVEKFFQARERYVALAKMIVRDAMYAEACGAMPEGLRGDLARMMTPYDGQPFGTERYVSYAVSVWTLLAATEPAAAEAAVEGVMKRVGK